MPKNLWNKNVPESLTVEGIVPRKTREAGKGLENVLEGRAGVVVAFLIELNFSIRFDFGSFRFVSNRIRTGIFIVRFNFSSIRRTFDSVRFRLGT